MAPHDTDLERGGCLDLLVEASDAIFEAACETPVQRSPAEDAAADRDNFMQHRSVYDGHGEYEFATARHYVPEYLRGGDRKS